MRDHKSGHSSYEKKATEVNVPGHSDKIFSLLFISSWIVGSYELRERERERERERLGLDVPLKCS